MIILMHSILLRKIFFDKAKPVMFSRELKDLIQG